MAAKRSTKTSHVEVPEKIDGQQFYGLQLDEEQTVFANAIWDPNIDIVFCNAKAGTGKTTIATGVANLLIEYGEFANLIYIMSPYGERKQGWLPGTITEKSSVYFEAFHQALITCNINPNVAINDESMTNQKNGTGFITCITDTFLRGVNLENAVIIIDEAQNFTVSQLKKTLTRVGKNVKVIVIGHTEQCDLEYSVKSGFEKYIHHFYGRDRVALCNLSLNHRGWISQCADELEE